MNRFDFLALTPSGSLAPFALAQATTTPKPPIVALVEVHRDAIAPLAPFTVSIALNNLAKKSVVLEFPTADLFRIDLLSQETPIWSSLTGRKPIPVNRRITVPPGMLKIANFTVDGTSDDHHALTPGKYVLRVAMLGTSFGAIVDQTLEIPAPTAIADVLRAKPGTVLTIAGEQVALGNAPALRDASGSLRISRSLALRPYGMYMVRGFLDASGDDRVFDVGRYAPMFDDVSTPAP